MSTRALAILLPNNGTSHTQVIKSLIGLTWELRNKNIPSLLKRENAQTL